MANTFTQPDTVARTTLGLLQRQLVLPSLVWRDFDAEFNGKIGDTVTVRVPARLDAREYAWRNDRTNPIVVDDIEEASISVSLNKHPYSAVAITDEELELDIANFGAQVLQPQVVAVAEKLEAYLATAMEGATYAEELTLDATDPFSTLIEASTKLNVANVARTDRVLVVGANVESVLLSSEKISRVDQSGQSGVLRDASIARLAGFNIVGSNAVDADSAFAFHRSAFILATRAPAVPEGAVTGSSQSYGGLAVRWIRDYDATRLQDRSIVSAFAGTAVVEDDEALVRAVKITNEAAS